MQQFAQEKVKLDIVINNAGVMSSKDNAKTCPDLEYAKLVLATNTAGPINLTQQLLPHLSQNCRIINVSSILGALDSQPKVVQERFSNPELAEGEISKAVYEYLEAVGKKEMKDWFCHAYGTSKMLLNAWSRFILQ